VAHFEERPKTMEGPLLALRVDLQRCQSRKQLEVKRTSRELIGRVGST
jgi:hypothetical protein